MSVITRHHRKHRFASHLGTCNPASRCTLEALEVRTLLSTVVVNTVGDPYYSMGNGEISLRTAISMANQNMTPTTITFDPTVFATAKTITLLPGYGKLDIYSVYNQTITITGPTAGVTIDANHSYGGFNINSGVTANLSGLTITNSTDRGISNSGTLTLTGVTVTNNTIEGGGGGIYNEGTATLNNVTISNNSASGQDGNGGGFLNIGTATLNNVTISNNNSFDKGGGYYNSSGTTTLTHVTITNNSTEYQGGGIENSSGTITLTNVIISNNTAYYGGGIETSTGTVTLTNVTISNNTATHGGGMFNFSTATLTNVTISNNTADYYGGGIYNFGSTTITNSTISNNTAANQGGGIYKSVGYGYQCTLANSVVAGNTAPTGPDFSLSESSEAITSNGHNFIGNGEDISWSNTDLHGTTAQPLNPLLTPLANHGGYTQTLMPAWNSPLVNQGSNALIPSGLTTDQRGQARVAYTTVDIGAVELQRSDIPAHARLVINLYRDTLGRDPEPAGLTSWTAKLDQGTVTPSQIAALFIGTTEYRAKRIQEVYQSILGRAADSSGLASWLDYFASGHTLEQMKAAFYGSAEYYAKRSNNDVLVILSYYQEILGRNPDNAGFIHWVDLLNKGTNRAAVATAIMSGSVEGAAKIVRACYTTFLLRNPDDAGLQAWITQVRNGVSEFSIITGFLGSAEYINRA